MSTSTMMSFIQPPLQLKPTFQEVQNNWPTVLTSSNSWNTNVSMPAYCACAKVYEVAQGDNNTISFGNTVVTKT